jgi:hypothetical protein
MVTYTAQHTRQQVVTPQRVLLHRRAAVYPPAGAGAPGRAAVPGVELLEADLVDRGWLLSPALRDALVRLDPADLVALGSGLLADCDALLGADRPHVPLFRGFPTSTPADTPAFYVDRVLARLVQRPDQPCVLCGAVGTVAPVNPCAHLVCATCFDGAEFSACPICHRRIALDDPFLKPGRERRAKGAGAPPARLRVLHLGTDLTVDAGVELGGLLARTAALSPADVADLGVLLDLRDRDDLSWLPERIPGRETKARVLAWLLAGAQVPADAVEAAARLVDTATDVLRLLVVRSGGDASLLDRPRLAPVPRPLRRALLALLDRIGPAQVVDDMRRNHRAWIAVGERLHPGEYAHRHPYAALAFAALRGTDLRGRPGGDRLVELAGTVRGCVVVDGRVEVPRWGRPVELALADGDMPAAVRVLATRPGELLRRLDHVLRLATTAGEQTVVFDALAGAVPAVSPAVLLSTLGALRTRTGELSTRVFFPASRIPLAYLRPEDRAPLPERVRDRAVGVLTGELLRRAGRLPGVPVAVLDRDVDGLVVPFGERTAARPLVTLARGSVLPVPAGRYLRLFCHWMENPTGPRIDLDLSVALFDADWAHVGTCDYTSLKVPGATHSGDLTSAPGPLGASEFIDLDLDVVTKARYAVVVVFSYTNQPFTEMAEAFAGVMVRSVPPRAGEVFDAQAVEQRFDLAGAGRMIMPLVVDLADRTVRWMDVTTQVKGTHHAVYRHRETLAVLASALVDGFRAGARVGLGELGRWHAAARASQVLVRDGDDVVRYRRRDGEDVPTFAARLADPSDHDGPAAADDAASAGLALLTRADLPVAAGAEVYALYPAGLDAAAVRLLTAADLAARLDPAAG